MNTVEETFVRAFVARDSRDRWLQFLPSPKNRTKALTRLPHTFDKDLDPRFVYDRRNPPPQIAAQVEALLTEWKKKNPEQLCHIIALGDYDETKMPFYETAMKLSQEFGAVAIVIPDQLAYYYAENNLNKEPQYLLFRPMGLSENNVT